MKILVYGWYHQGNLGDELFKQAFTQLFPTYHFEFTDFITANQLQNVDGVFVGGGSFLGELFRITDDALPLLIRKKICYLGVGAETDIHPSHQAIMASANLIATRTPEHLEKIRSINDNVMSIPDLVYCLVGDISPRKIDRSVLILPNVTVVPTWKDAHWAHVSWNYFKSEFSQFLDELAESKHNAVNFLPLCVNPQQDDTRVADELINATTHRSFFKVHSHPQTLQDATRLISEYEIIITQRYHGMVLADMIGAKYFSIYHHDKLKNPKGNDLPYYGITKAGLWTQLEFQKKTKVSPHLPIDRNIIRDLTQKVDDALCGGQK